MNSVDMACEQLMQLVQVAKQKTVDKQTVYLKFTQTAKDEDKICQVANHRDEDNLTIIQDAEHSYQDNLRMIQEPEDKARRLSWREAFSLWHTVCADPQISLQHESNQASDNTTPTGRRHPGYLRHWGDFHDLHRVAFKQVSNQLDRPEASAFESQDYYQTDAPRLDRPELVSYKESKVENLVLEAWARMGNAIIGFKMPSDHTLDNINNRRSQLHKDSEARFRPVTTAPPANSPYDKVCYMTTPGQTLSRDLFVVQYKSPDMLAPDVVKNGLHDMELEQIRQRINLATDNGREGAIAAVITQIFDSMVDKGLSYGYVKEGSTFIFLFTRPDNPSILYYEKVILGPALISSSDPEETLRLTAVGLISAFVQMSLGSQPWSKALRSKALEELPIWRVDESKMLKTPNCSRSEFDKSALSKAIQKHENTAFLPYSPTATWVKAKVRQDQSGCPALEKHNNSTFLPYSPTATWVKAKARQGPDQSGCWEGKDSALEKPSNSTFLPYSPTATWVKAKARRGPDCQKGGSVLSRNEDSSGDQGQSYLKIAKSPTATWAEAKGRQDQVCCQKDGGVLSRNDDSSGGQGEFAPTRPDRPYCTQACLLGLIRGYVLDKKCPNVEAHRKKARDYGRNNKYMSRRLRNKRHALDQPTLARLIEEQLQRPEREDIGVIQSLDRSGWAGALFRLELVSHGYTFVGKGTVQPLMQALHTEAEMYKRMDAIQGKAIPVYLGSIDLQAAFHLTSRVAIVHLMLLSWAGEEAWQCGIKAERLWLETARTNAEVAALGVQQADLRRQNVLWNFELDRAILIDFEYAHVEEAQNVIEASIAEEANAKEELKLLGQRSMGMEQSKKPSVRRTRQCGK